MTKDEIVEEMAAKFEDLISACAYDEWPAENLEPYKVALRLYRSRNNTKVSTPQFEAFWNGSPPLPMIKSMSADRRQHLGQRAQEDFFVENWKEGIERISKSSFCLGKNDRGWQATVDWFLRPGTLVKIMEGLYDDRKPKPVVVRKNSAVYTTPMVDDAKKWKETQLAENDGLPSF